MSHEQSYLPKATRRSCGRRLISRQLSNIGQTRRAREALIIAWGFRYGNPVLNSYSTQWRLTLSEHDVLANQKHILENQKAILANQDAIKDNQHAIKDTQKIIVENQGAIKKNQESLDVILKNQHEILALLKK
jgi:hypothetical protein